ncbi:hypothetical protein GCM10017562_10160 [Streptomyces roseofulvus]
MFTAASDQSTGTGTYVARESFEGTLHGRAGVIVPASGTGAMTGITGTGGLAVDPDGTHRVWVDYELAP